MSACLGRSHFAAEKQGETNKQQTAKTHFL